LLGVLRQVVAIDGGHPDPAPSLLFSGELDHGTRDSGWRNLPVPTADPTDPAAGLLATLAALGPEQVRSALASSPRSEELVLRLARSWIEDGRFLEAEAELDSPELQPPGWRVAWWRGVMHLAAGRPKDAESFFEAVAAELPGELPPKLALAVAFERASQDDDAGAPTGRHAVRKTPASDRQEAARYYELVASTNPGYVSASFGLARVRLDEGDRPGALAALDRVPRTSSAYEAAQVALCRIRCAEVGGSRPDLGDLMSASHIHEALALEPSLRLPLARDLLSQALALVAEDGVAAHEGVVLLSATLDVVAHRAALERT
jgi:serine/threonine-protein kinase PknG